MIAFESFDLKASPNRLARQLNHSDDVCSTNVLLADLISKIETALDAKQSLQSAQCESKLINFYH